MSEERTRSLSSQVKDSDEFASFAQKGQPSCRNCGHLVENLDPQPCVHERPVIFASPFSSCQGYAAPVNHNFHPQVEFESDSSNRQCVPQKEVSLFLSSNQKTRSQNPTLWARDAVPPLCKINRLQRNKESTATVINERKKSFPVNQSVNGSTRPHAPARVYNGKSEPEKRIVDRQNDSNPLGRKRRPASISKQGESSGFMRKQPYSFPHAMHEKELGYKFHSVNNRRGSAHVPERTVCPVDNNVEVAKRKVQNLSSCDDSLGKSALNENVGRATSQKPLPSSGDALGALLEQKLKELNHQGEDIGGDAPKKTTATILQELISALTSELPLQQDESPTMYNGNNNNIIRDWSNLSKSTSSTNSQANRMTVNPPFDQSLENEHLSPGSVLEAYFSNESCFSSSVDDSVGHKMLDESMDCSYYGPRSRGPDTELSDSANSANLAKTSKELAINIIENVSKILCHGSVATCGMNQSKLDQGKGVLLNALLVFQDAAFPGRGCPVEHLLLDELETLASVLWMNFGCSLGIEDGKEVNQLKRFAFDASIEYLDLRFEIYPKVGSKVSAKLPLCTNSANMLILEILEEVRRWEGLSRFVHDQLIEREMSLSLGKWTQFETETYETGMEISKHVFEVLVDEIVMDFWN